MKRNLFEFIKYADWRLWANIKFIDSSGVWYLDLYLINPVFNKYIYEVYKGKEMHRHYVQADTFFLSVIVEDLNL